MHSTKAQKFGNAGVGAWPLGSDTQNDLIKGKEETCRWSARNYMSARECRLEYARK